MFLFLFFMVAGEVGLHNEMEMAREVGLVKKGLASDSDSAGK